MTAKTLTPEELICLDRCGSYAYYHLLRSHYERGACPFCDLDRARNKVLWEDLHFYMWEVPQDIQNPKKKLERHILIVPKRHMTCMHDDLLDPEWLSYAKACRQMFWEFPELKKLGGMEATRFGNMFYNAGTVLHAHSNFKVPVRDAAVDEPISKDLDNQRENAERARKFAIRYEAGELP